MIQIQMHFLTNMLVATQALKCSIKFGVHHIPEARQVKCDVPHFCHFYPIQVCIGNCNWQLGNQVIDFQCHRVQYRGWEMKNFMAPFYRWGSTASRLPSHYKEAVDFFGPSAKAERVLWIGVCPSFHPSVQKFSWDWLIKFFGNSGWC